MFLDRDDEWKPGDGLCAPMPKPKPERPYDKEEGLFAGINEQANRNTVSSKSCSHKKVYAPYQFQSYPPKTPWICSLCGEEGVDISPIETDAYDLVKKKFNK